MSNKDDPRFPRLLICEGPEDEFFFHRLIQILELPQFHIWPAGGRRGQTGGYTKFVDAIRSFKIERPKSFRSLRDILIVADNDEVPGERFRNVCDHIEKFFGAGTAPVAPLQKTNTHPAVTVLMIPWTNECGHLERLCLDSARDANRNIGGHVDTFMNLIAAERWGNESRFGKAWLRTNLAARCERDPFIPLGYVFRDERYHDLIPANHPSFQRIVNFLATFAAAGDAVG